MTSLFEPKRINRLTIRNRFIRSATHEGMADEAGNPTEALVSLYESLTTGGVGLIISGHIMVEKRGQASPLQLGLFEDGQISAFQGLTERVHEFDGLVVAQLAHAGLFALMKKTGIQAVAPSNVQGFSKNEPKVLDDEDIQTVVQSFCAAAERAQTAGFDGIQLHAAHGYLLSQFLSPEFNKRTDTHGGSVKNRARILDTIIRKIRGVVGTDFPILVKMNCADYLEGGLTVSDAKETAKLLQDFGADAIEVSGGALVSKGQGPSRKVEGSGDESYFIDAAAHIKSDLTIPVISVGGHRSLAAVNQFVAGGKTDMISLSRPFIREPDLVNKWENGQSNRSECISCNKCFRSILLGKGVRCLASS